MLRLVGAATLLVTFVAASSIYYADENSDAGYYADEANYDSYMSDWNQDWAMLSGRFYQPKCVDIPSNLSLCRNIGYSQMRLPNLLDHDTLAEVTQQAKSWVPLLGIRCHPDTQLFLCSLFSPVCLERRMIWPCRSLCEDVKGSCEGYMNKYGFPWPEMLRCDKFRPDNDLCIGLRDHNKPDDTVCEPCNKPETFEGILDNFCSAEFVIRIKIDENVLSGGEIKLTPQRKKRTYKKGSLTKRDLKSLTFYIENGEHCECSKLENTNKKFLVMGKRDGDKLKLTYVMEYDRNNNKDLKRALRAFRKNENICQDIHVLTDDKKDGRRRKNKNIAGGNQTAVVVQGEGQPGTPIEGQGEISTKGPATEVQPINTANVENGRKERRRKKGEGRKRGENGNADRNRKGRRKDRKRNKGNRDNDNAMTREERRKRREQRKELRQLDRLRRQRDRRTLDIIDVA